MRRALLQPGVLNRFGSCAVSSPCDTVWCCPSPCLVWGCAPSTTALLCCVLSWKALGVAVTPLCWGLSLLTVAQRIIEMKEHTVELSCGELEEPDQCRVRVQAVPMELPQPSALEVGPVGLLLLMPWSCPGHTAFPI